MRAEQAEKKLNLGLRIGIAKSKTWSLEEGRGVTGIGYFFSVSNISESETVELVKAELIGIEPDEVKILPLPLHIRHADYETLEMSVHASTTGSYKNILV